MSASLLAYRHSSGLSSPEKRELADKFFLIEQAICRRRHNLIKHRLLPRLGDDISREFKFHLRKETHIVASNHCASSFSSDRAIRRAAKYSSTENGQHPVPVRPAFLFKLCDSLSGKQTHLSSGVSLSCAAEMSRNSTVPRTASAGILHLTRYSPAGLSCQTFPDFSSPKSFTR